MSDIALPDQSRAELEDYDIFEKFVKLYSEDFDQEVLDHNLTVYREFLVSNRHISAYYDEHSQRHVDSTLLLVDTLAKCLRKLGKMNGYVYFMECTFHMYSILSVMVSFKFFDDCYHGFWDDEAMDIPNFMSRELTIV